MIIYVHYKNHEAYRIVNINAKIQVNDEWVNAVIYEPLKTPGLHFTRSAEEFDEKFMKVNIPEQLLRNR